MSILKFIDYTIFLLSLNEDVPWQELFRLYNIHNIKGEVS